MNDVIDDKSLGDNANPIGMSIFSITEPFNAQEDTGVPFHRNFNSSLRRDHQKNFLLASSL